MKKGVKKGLTVVGIIFGVIIILMILIPVLFKGKIKDAVIKAANEQLNAKVDIKDFGLSLFSNFPNATLSLDDATIIGVGDFATDTLLQAKSASITINLASLFGDNYKISKINLDRASVYAKVLADGSVNWDIMKADSTTVGTDNTNTDNPFNLNLKKISVKDCSVIFQNDSTNMKFVMSGWNGDISGDFSASETTLNTSSTINELSFSMAGMPYLVKVKGVAEATISANLDKMNFTFDKSNLQINDLKASIDGSFGFVGEDGMEFDLKLNAPDTQFKDILSVLPAMYTDDFKDVKTEGTAKIDAYVKGLMEGDKYPAFDIKIAVNDAMFQYPSLPKSVNNINVDLGITNPGGVFDNTVIDISKFSFNLGGNPFNGTLRITTPDSDPNLKLTAKGLLNLAMIKEVYPLDKGTDLNGVITADINLATAMSAIEKEQYEQVSATGHLKVDQMIYKSSGMPDVKVNNTNLEFTPRYVNLSSMDVTIGKNDISANGRLENFIAYALKDKTLKGQLNIKSNYLNANDFMGDTASTTSGADTTATSSDNIIIPKNIDFALTANLKQVVYDKINITNLNGAVNVQNGVLSLNNVSANALGGSAKITGKYDTSNPKDPKVNFAINLSNVSFAETFKSVESIQKFAPIFDKLTGTYSMNMNMNTSLGATLAQTLGALTATGGLQTSNVKVEGVESLTALSSALKTDAFKSFSAKDINLPFKISDGRLATDPFSVNVGDGSVMKLEGSTGLDQTINYKGTVSMPKSMTNKYVSTVPITIGGTFSSPKIGIDSKALAQDALSNLASGLLGGSSNGNSADASAKLSGDKDKQIQNIRDKADQTATQLIEEAQKASDQAVSAAGSNPLAKAAAKAGGKKLVEEANKQAQKLRADAEEQIKKLE